MKNSGIDDYFGPDDSDDVLKADRERRTLSMVFRECPISLSEEQRCHGKRFASRILSDAAAMFGPTGQKAPLHFPEDIEAIECIGLDTRASRTPLGCSYLFEVTNKPIEGEHEIGTDKPERFVTAFTGHQLATVFACYDKNDPHYQTMLATAEEQVSGLELGYACRAIEKARSGGSTPGPVV